MFFKGLLLKKNSLINIKSTGMKAVVQRVSSAKVIVNGEEVSSIGKGVLALIGMTKSDNEKDVHYIARKLLNMRLFEDENQKRWAKSASQLGLEIMCVSQFTLYCKLKGNKPDFHQALPSEESNTLYNKLLTELKIMYNPLLVKDGVFGAHMNVHIENDGPVTIEIESSTSS